MTGEQLGQLRFGEGLVCLKGIPPFNLQNDGDSGGIGDVQCLVPETQHILCVFLAVIVQIEHRKRPDILRQRPVGGDGPFPERAPP